MTSLELRKKCEKSLDFLKSELAQIRTGRATPALIESIEIDAYGSKMTVKELGSITTLDPENLVVVPWDKNLLGDISKGIRESDLHLNPVEESDRLRVPVPTLTEERRREFAKIVSIKVEECKNALRNIRQDAMKDVDKDFESKVIGEDEKFDQRDEVEKVTKELILEAESTGETKKSDLMTV